MSLAGKLIEILYIDDEPDFAEMAATFLEREDNRLEVDTATSANEGVDRLADNKYQCIISDYDMPGENGIEFLETVRETHPDLPFILYTGKGSETVASDAISAGVTDYLQKRSGTDQYELLANRITNAVSQFRAEQQVQEEQKRCEILFNRLSQAIVDVEYRDNDPIVRRVNSTFEDTFGYDGDDMIGESLDDYIVPEDQTDEAASINQRIQAGGVLNGEKVTRQTADGSREFLLEKSMYTDGSGGFAIYTDITERRGENPEFERSHQFLKALSTALPEYTFVYDENGKCLDAVTGWRQDHLYANEELIGSTVDTVLNEEAARKVREAIRTALDSGKRQTVEYEIQKSSQASRYEAYVTPLTDGYEGRPAAVLTARDITDRWQHKRELENQNERLDEFAGVVSHDLRNPLNIAEGRLELARKECNSEHLETVATAHDRMNALIEDLLMLAREGNNATDLEPINLAELSENCWRSVKTADATIQTSTKQTVQADQGRLTQLLENLICNAIEHGGSDVTVTVGQLENGFYVEDDGPGISKDSHEEVFDAGYTTTDQGTGFGLRIVKQVASTHGWDITVTNSSTGGARFEITGVRCFE